MTHDKDSLRESEYKWLTDARGHRYEAKSCPACSVGAGVQVFHPLEDFGYRVMNKGELEERTLIQSYCKRCRAGGGKHAS